MHTERPPAPASTTPSSPRPPRNYGRPATASRPGPGLRALAPCLPAAVVLALAVPSCTPSYYNRSADRETSGIISRKGPGVPNMDSDFSIEEPESASLAELRKRAKTPDFLGDVVAALEEDATIITLAEALEIAVTHSREYRQRKEDLYLQALDLTLIRYEFDVIPRAGAGLTYSENSDSVSPGTPENIESGINSILRDSTVARTATVGFDWLLKTGARISSDLTLDFVRFVNGDLRTINNSSLVASVSQPLLRGVGVLVTTEPLTQAERDLLYSIRDFARFRKEFTVRIATDYYDILRKRDSVNNNWLGYQGFKQSIVREEELAKEDRSTLTELGQLQQAALISELAWINDLRSYRDALDKFKLDLGIPVESRVVLSDSELNKLEIIDPSLAREEAAEVAARTRLDLENSRERNEDSIRRIKVFAQDLLPGLTFGADINLNAPTGFNRTSLDLELNRWSAGLNFDLDPDKKAERNAYRSALIALQRTTRQLELDSDQVRLEIYNAWRNLEQARRQFDISEVGVQVAETRLEEQQLLMELGRGTARDLVDAQDDLVNSQNDRTDALVSHTTARLNFWRDMGILFTNKDGSWVRNLKDEGR
ncbi:MAG: TolC family protein [Verrucomicrobiales bacterium]